MTKLILGEMDTESPWRCWYISPAEDNEVCLLTGIYCLGALNNRPYGCPLVEVKDGVK